MTFCLSAQFARAALLMEPQEVGKDFGIDLRASRYTSNASEAAKMDYS